MSHIMSSNNISILITKEAYKVQENDKVPKPANEPVLIPGLVAHSLFD